MSMVDPEGRGLPLAMRHVGRQATAAFSPLDLTGVMGWYDSSDITGLWKDTARTSAVTADGDIVKGVTDKSGAGNHLSEATNGPTYKTGIQNGLSVLRFDGVNDIIAKTGITWGTSPTIFIAFNKRSAINASTMTALELGNGFLNCQGVVDATRWYWLRNEAAANVVITGATVAAHVVSIAYTSNAQLDIYVDGVSGASFDPLNISGAGRIGLGANAGVTTPSDIDVFEVIACNGAALTASARQAGEAYLKARWATP